MPSTGGSLFGLQESNPVDPQVAYKGPAQNFGRANDPMVRLTIGGVNVFGGRLALNHRTRGLIGGLGVSGDFRGPITTSLGALAKHCD